MWSRENVACDAQHQPIYASSREMSIYNNSRTCLGRSVCLSSSSRLHQLDRWYFLQSSDEDSQNITILTTSIIQQDPTQTDMTVLHISGETPMLRSGPFLRCWYCVAFRRGHGGFASLEQGMFAYRREKEPSDLISLK